MNKVMNWLRQRKLAIVTGLGLLGASAAHAADPTSVGEVITNVEGISATATTAYIGAAVLGLGIFTVSVIFYVVRRGVKTR